jgi:hypothetical protein
LPSPPPERHDRPFLPPSSTAAKPEPPPHQPPLRTRDLPDFIRNFNNSNKGSGTKASGSCRLHVYVRKGARQEIALPVVLRFAIRNIMVVFITLVAGKMGADETDEVLMIETVTAFGPREQVNKKTPS